MPILDRTSLEQSPLADLHAIASELSIDGYRRLRKPQLIEAILGRQGPEDGGEEPPAAEEPPASEEPSAAEKASASEEPEPEAAPARRRGRGRGRRSSEPKPRAEGAGESEAEPEGGAEAQQDQRERPGDEPVEGVVELLPNGSGFVRVNPPDPSDGDVYISSAQVRRCELVTGDRVAGPRRAPRRSERFAALVRIDTINGRPAAELADSARYDDLPASFPTERFELGADVDPTIQAIVSAAPVGRGSRVTIAGAAQTGKTELLRRLASELAGREELQVWVALAGVRPEELQEWRAGTVAPAVALGFGASQEAQAQAVEGTVDQARRIAARGAHAVVLIDTLTGLPHHVARKALAAARHLEGGSLTVIATAEAPFGGETTVITLDRALAREGSFPAVDRDQTWTMRAELLQG